jgi:hypothetical protein
MNPWERFWFRPSSRRGLDVARVLVAANALWILLSRPDLPDLAAWPAPFWVGSRLLRVRYAAVFPAGVERVLYWIACAALVAVIANVATRASALIAGLLLYHFAPFENLLSSHVGPYFNGLTLPVLALLVFGFAAPEARPSAENRWPFALIQLLFSFTYLLAGAAKLRTSGLLWMSASNFRGTVEVFNAFEPAERPLAAFLIAHPMLCTAIAIATVVVELSIIAVLLRPRLAYVVVPLLLLGHVGIYLTLGVIFLNAPLVLLLFDWDRMR